MNETNIADNGDVTTKLSDNGDVPAALADNGDVTTKLPDNRDVPAALADKGDVTTKLSDNRDVPAALADKGDVTTKLSDNGDIPAALNEIFGSRRFNSYSGYFKRTFGGRIQKVTIDAGFTCPNRDGTVGTGGCTFCLNDAFSPSYCQSSKSVTQQIDEGILFHSRRYEKAQQYLAYFQSFSNTYKPIEELRTIYAEALAHTQVVGLVIGTRPDCVDEEKLDFFKNLSNEKYVIVEYGVESVYDHTLEAVNRGHDFAAARRAIELTAAKGIHCGAHFIIGFPGETREMIINSAEKINSLPINTVKFHQLQIFKGTAMAADYEQNPQKYTFFELDEYIDLFIDLLEKLRPDIVLERFAGEAPPRYHAGHPWGLVRNEQLMQMFEKRLIERKTYQGRLSNVQ